MTHPVRVRLTDMSHWRHSHSLSHTQHTSMPPSRDASDGCTGAQPSEFVAIGGGAVCTSSAARQHIKHENSQQRSMTSISCPIAPYLAVLQQELDELMQQEDESYSFAAWFVSPCCYPMNQVGCLLLHYCLSWPCDNGRKGSVCVKTHKIS